MKRKSFLATAAGVAATMASLKIAHATTSPGTQVTQVTPFSGWELGRATRELQSIRQQLRPLITGASKDPHETIRGRAAQLMRQADSLLAQAYEIIRKGL
jgi:hypothetical protein